MELLTQLTSEYANYAKSEKYSDNDSTLGNPIDYIMSLDGKKIRPLLVQLGYKAFKSDAHTSLPLAHAYEIFHNFTLMHDDIMDQADLRRGQQTAHLKYGLNAAILSGDAMLILAYQYILDQFPNSIGLDIIQKFNKIAYQICVGQQMDIDFELREYVLPEDYIEMIRLKTAVLLGSALESGALAAGASQPIAQSMYVIGELLGIGFQIQDDFLDVYGDQKLIGKTSGGDILQNKKTYLFNLAYQLGDDMIKKSLSDLYNEKHDGKNNKIDQVKSIFDHLEINTKTSQESQKYIEEAKQILRNLTIAPDAKKALFILIDRLSGRSH